MNIVVTRALFVGVGLTGLISLNAHATALETLSLTFASGATFTGTVAFANDYSSVTGVNGILTGYTATDFSYVGGTGTDPISWVLNPGFNYSYTSLPNVFETYLFDGTPGDYTTLNNEVVFSYDYTAAPNLVLTSAGDGNAVNYTDPAVSGSLSPVPLPGALPMLAVALLGVASWGSRRGGRAI